MHSSTYIVHTQFIHITRIQCSHAIIREHSYEVIIRNLTRVRQCTGFKAPRGPSLNLAYPSPFPTVKYQRCPYPWPYHIILTIKRYLRASIASRRPNDVIHDHFRFGGVRGPPVIPQVEGVDFGVVCPHWPNGFNVVLIVCGAI